MLIESISLDIAQKLIKAALAEAERQHLSIAAYVVDSGGHLIAAQRMDGVSYMITEVARRKAITAFIFQLPSEDLKQITDANPVVAADLAKNPDLCAVPGGVPIVVNGQFVGGFGVSGGSSEQDRALAQLSLSAMSGDESRALALRVYEAINARDMDTLETLFDPNIVRHAMGEVGFEQAKATTLKVFETTPGLHFVVEDAIGDGDRAALRVTVHGRPLELGQEPPTILEIFRIAHGRVAEIWGAGSAPRRSVDKAP